MQAGAGVFYDGANAGSTLQVNNSAFSSNFLDSPYTGSPQTYSLGGALSFQSVLGSHACHSFNSPCPSNACRAQAA